MARKSGPKQLKRAPAPEFWPIHRKDSFWAPSTRSGSHPRPRSFPIVIVLREILGYAKTSGEAVSITARGGFRVDGVSRRDHRFPVGLMDIIRIEGIPHAFRVMPKPGRGLTLSPIENREAGFKLCQIMAKKTLDNGIFQIRLHDGRNLVLKPRDSQKSEEEFHVGGSLQLTVPELKIMKYVPMNVGSIGLVTDGRNQGAYGKISTITPGSHARHKLVRLVTEAEPFETPAQYVLPVGVETPLVALR